MFDERARTYYSISSSTLMGHPIGIARARLDALPAHAHNGTPVPRTRSSALENERRDSARTGTRLSNREKF